MNTKPTKDLCFQCGKELVLVKIYEEMVGNSLVKTTLMNCSDPECRKRTEATLRSEKRRRDEAMMIKNNNKTFTSNTAKSKN